MKRAIKKIKLTSLILLMFCLFWPIELFAENIRPAYPSAWAPTVIIGKNNEETLVQKDPLQAGKLRYGVTKANTSVDGGLYRSGTLDVSYIPYKDKQDQEIRQVRSYYPLIYEGVVAPYEEADKGSPTSAGSPIFLIENDEEYSKHFNKPQLAGGTKADIKQTLYNELGEKDVNGKVVVTTGSKIADPELAIELRQFPNKDNSRIVHLIEIKNNSNKKRTVYPIRQVDTELDGNDTVPVYSRGTNPKTGEIDGLYIKTPARGKTDARYSKSDPPKLMFPELPPSQSYRLDYYLRGEKGSNENWPEYYIGGNWAGYYKDETKIDQVTTRGFKNSFGELDKFGQTDTVKKSMTETDPSVPLIDAGVDSGIWMSWGKVELEPGDTYIARYEVGISVETDTEKSKTAINKTAEKEGRTDNYPGDVIEYTVTYKSKKGDLDELKFTDQLKDVYEDATVDYINGGDNKATLNIYKADGTGIKETKEYDMTNEKVYDKGTATLSVPSTEESGLSLKENEIAELKFTVKLSDNSAKTDVVNIANVKSETSEQTSVEEDVTLDNPIPVSENKGKVTIKYQDKNGNELSLDKVLEGKIDSTYDASKEPKPKINGYEFEELKSGSETGKFTSSPQEIVYQYKENSFDIRQEVFDKDGNNANGQSVDMGGLLKYKTTVSSNLDSSTGIKYNDFTVTANVSPHITVDESSIKFETAKGTTITNVVYNSTTNTITGTIAASDSIDSDEDLILSYEGTVKNVFDVDIVADSIAGGTYTPYPPSTPPKPQVLGTPKPSNKVTTKRGAGNLEFSASSLWDFGSNEIKNEKEEIPLKNVASSNLTVTDNRAPGNDWYLTAQLDKEFTNTTSGNVMKNILKYRKAAGDTSTITIPFGSASDILIQGNTSAADRGKPINLASDWGTKNGKGLFLDVPGGIAKKGVYEADITWTLSDTP